MRNRALRGCLIVVFAICVILLENIGSVAKKRVKPQPNAQQSQQQSEADKRGTIDAPFIIKSLPAEKNQQEADDDARDKNDKRWNDRATIFVAVATAVILIFQLIVFGWQAHRLKQTIAAMKKIGADQSRDMQASIAIADKAAKAANQSADTAIRNTEAFMNSDGAQLWVDEVRIHGIRTTPAALKLSYVIRNFGSSPGWVHHKPARIFIGNVLPEERDLNQIDTPEIIFVPSKHFTIGETNIPFVIPQSTIDALLAPNPITFMFVYGSINYRDIFRRDRRAGFAYKIIFGGSDISESSPIAGGEAYWDYQ